MPPLDFLRALFVSLGVFLGTLLLSIPMVAFYAYVIEPGHPREFYDAAAQRIAPWSSHLAGPLLLFWMNLRGAMRRPQRNATFFAWATIAGYVAIDLASVPLFSIAFSAVLTLTFAASLAGKAAGALAGARLGAQWSRHRAGIR